MKHRTPKKTLLSLMLLAAFGGAVVADAVAYDARSADRGGRKNSGKPVLIWKIFLVLFDLFLIWFLLGLVMGLGILPAIDLGYTWFGHVLSSVTVRLS